MSVSEFRKRAFAFFLCLASLADGCSSERRRDSVATISSLLQLDTNGSDQIIFVRGYFSSGDGGGGLFYYDPNSNEATNRGTVFKPKFGAGRWMRQCSGSINAAWFGWTVGTNSPTIRDRNKEVLNHIVSLCAPGGGAIEIPRGLAYCSTGIVIPGLSGLTFRGEVPIVGKGAITSHRVLTNFSGIGFVGSGTAIDCSNGRANGIHFQDLVLGYAYFDSKESEPAPSYIVKAGASGGITRCFLHGATIACFEGGDSLINYTILNSQFGFTDQLRVSGDAFHIPATSHSTTLFVASSYFQKARKGLFLEQAEAFHFVSCVFESNLEEGIKLLRTSSVYPTRSTSFQSCYVEDNQRSRTMDVQYQIDVDSRDPSNYGFETLVFDGCHFTPKSGPYEQNRLLLSINAALCPEFRNCQGFGYNSNTIDVEVSLGKYARNVLFHRCNSVTLNRKYLRGTSAVVVSCFD